MLVIKRPLDQTELMKRIIFGLTLLFASISSSFGQSPPAVLVKELPETYCSETLSAELDRFAIEINQVPGSTAYIVFYGKQSQEGKNLLYLIQPERYLTGFNRLDKSSIVTTRGNDREKMLVQLWMVPPGGTPPDVQGSFTPASIDSPVIFDRSWADWHKWDNSEWTIYSYSFANWGCGMDVNLDAFSKVLLSQPKLTGHLVVYTQPNKGKGRARKVSEFAIKELVNQYKVPGERLAATWGGTRPEPELELWLVPSGAKLPIDGKKLR